MSSILINMINCFQTNEDTIWTKHLHFIRNNYLHFNNSFKNGI